MASISKAIMASLLVSLFILNLVHAAVPTVNGYGSGEKIDCRAACVARCRLASRQKMCLRACGTCCGRCQCVPSGTSGNQDVCPCYATMTTHGGRLKCP
ncbi:hypothetical protein V2J09_019850 [Rumex salicifolius]